MGRFQDAFLNNATDVWRGLLAEFIGTLFLVLIGCGACIHWSRADIVQISLAFGVTVATIVQCFGHVSGHINPAVTIGLLVTRKIGALRCVLYVVSQCVGTVVGAALLRGFTPILLHKTMGATMFNTTISSYEAFGVECFITFVLVLTVFAVSDPNRDDVKGSPSLAIGLSVTACHLFAISYTGSSMNPARSFGPAVYWAGPILGGILAALLYRFVFRAPKPASSCESLVDRELKPTYEAI
uniref:Aquaporin n=1 Tax=Strigamia maritima TaxID=126957 RepID=T1JF08_STRMM